MIKNFSDFTGFQDGGDDFHIPAWPSRKRGKLAKSDAHNLWERIEKYETAILLFARDTHVSFTNNRAGLRMANKRYNPLVATQIALMGRAHGIWGEVTGEGSSLGKLENSADWYVP